MLPSGRMKPPVMRQPISGAMVVLVLLDVVELVELLVLLDVLELVELLVLLEVLELVELLVLELVELLVLLEVLELVELLVLLDVLELVEVLVVVVTTSVPSCFCERNGWSTAASCSVPSARVSSGPVWSPARTSATASNTPALTLSVHISVPPIAVGGDPAGRLRFVVIFCGMVKSGVPSAPGQKKLTSTSVASHATRLMLGSSRLKMLKL